MSDITDAQEVAIAACIQAITSGYEAHRFGKIIVLVPPMEQDEGARVEQAIKDGFRDALRKQDE